MYVDLFCSRTCRMMARGVLLGTALRMVALDSSLRLVNHRNTH